MEKLLEYWDITVGVHLITVTMETYGVLSEQTITLVSETGRRVA
jgi:hypothetical protein